MSTTSNCKSGTLVLIMVCCGLLFLVCCTIVVAVADSDPPAAAAADSNAIGHYLERIKLFVSWAQSHFLPPGVNYLMGGTMNQVVEKVIDGLQSFGARKASVTSTANSDRKADGDEL